jgi:hypothetical protein
MRRNINLSLFAAVGSVCLIGSALAADMTGDEIKAAISGKSTYIETNAAGSASGATGSAVIYWAADGSALFKTPKGDLWHGTWTTKSDSLCVDWKEQPNNPCTKYVKDGNTITLINVANGQTRGKIAKIADGNAEKLGP